MKELEEFLRLEKKCEEAYEEEKRQLLKDMHVPNFEDTLQEVDFILKMGVKMKIEGKMMHLTPPLEKSFNLIELESPRHHRSNSTSCVTPCSTESRDNRKFFHA